MGGCCAAEAGSIVEPPDELGKVQAKTSTPPTDTPKTDASKGRKKKYGKNKPIEFGYWKIRGLGQPIRYMLEYTEHPYQEQTFEMGEPPKFSLESWTSVKNDMNLSFPSLPYIIDGETRLTNDHAIMVYLATSYAPELLGRSPEEQAEMDMLQSMLKDTKAQLTGPCYRPNIDRQDLANQAKHRMDPIVAYLGKKEYLCREDVCLVDFYLLELCEYVDWLTEGTFMTANKSIARYVRRMRGLKTIKRYIKSDKYLAKPFNMKNAKINNI